ncbi:MAG: DUF288 domain-containing protein [Limnoraphis sp. WC205]|nr:DUF288 domain-containing protein [Limnoraphis sp. WC205]
MAQNQHIVITSINPPTKAVKEFATFPEWKTIVIGDRKSPSDWHCGQASFFSIEDQASLGFKLNEKLPFNHYSRKMLGYLIAIQQGANVIFDTDDDNIPKGELLIPNLDSQTKFTSENLGFINVYQQYTEQKIWPRGLPLKYVNQSADWISKLSVESLSCQVPIWQGLADGDPDVDAIYRLTNNTPCYFRNQGNLVLGKNTISPFNSQATFFTKDAFPLMYLPAKVSFRFTDILRGIVAQPILWSKGWSLGFTNPIVFQDRNEHDFMSDFEQEIPVFLQVEKALKTVNDALTPSMNISEMLVAAYSALSQYNIVQSSEIELLQVWLQDLNRIG